MLAYSIHSTTQKTREHVISISYNDDSRIITLPLSYNVRRHHLSSGRQAFDTAIGSLS